LGKIAIEIGVSPFRKKESIYHKTLGEALLKTFQRAGPIYIEFGQTLSTRPDIIGRRNSRIFKGVCRIKLPPFSYHIAKDMIEKEFKQKLERYFC
jgi:ubiquinone biosynthesis protein